VSLIFKCRGQGVIRIGTILCATLLLVGHAPVLHASDAQTVLRCTTVQENDRVRQVCEQGAVTDKILVALPEALQPLETGSILKAIINIPLPEHPAGPIILLPENGLLSGGTNPASAKPGLPDIRLPEPDLPPLAILPIEKKPDIVPLAETPEAERTRMPVEVLQLAIKRLKPRDGLSDKEITGVAQFYAARNFKPAWIDNGHWNNAAKAVRKRLSLASEDGLDPARYPTVAAFVGEGEPQWHALAAAEVQLSDAVLRYARDASIGQIEPWRVHAFITPTRVSPESEQVLASVSQASDAGHALQTFNPPHKEYRALRRKLAELRANASLPVSETIPDGPILRIGMRDARVPLIRDRLGLGYDSAPVYDRSVSTKVASLQKAAGLPVNGLFTAQTRRALLGELPTADEAEIIANMERWRWLPRTLGEDYIFVNVPELTVEMQRAGKVIHTSRIIIGKNDSQTPVFSDMMDHIVVNPSWFVPPSVLKKDPRYLDPVWTEARGYTLRKRGNVVTVRVPPSASNALGNVKFMFPNQHAVYLHDTPGRHLFNARNRLLSNGCVRVENPFRLAAAIFEAEGWSEERFKRQIGGGERFMKLRKKLPIHIAYFTLTVDGSGQLVRHGDVYGHSLRLRQLLGLS
jgi:L,D-transpeptidase YcbB